MKGWHKHPLTKIILVITAIVTPAAAAVSLVLLAGFMNTDLLGKMFWAEDYQYEDTESFEGLMLSSMATMLSQEAVAEQFDTDGKYDPDKLVDIMEYAASGNITGENISGLAYRIKDLADWNDNYGVEYVDVYENYGTEDEGSDSGTSSIGSEKSSSESGSGSGADNIIVCRKEDDTYRYYWMSDFKNQLSEGKLRLEISSEERQRFLDELKSGYIWQEDRDLLVRDEEGTAYTDVWTFDGGQIRERFAPDGAKDILEVVNKTPALNGKLQEVYENLVQSLTIGNQISEYQAETALFSEGNTNFTYLFVNEDKKKVYTNHRAFQNYKDAQKNMEALAEDGNIRYVLVRPTLNEFESNLDVVPTYWQNHVERYDFLGDDYTVMAAVDTSYPIHDLFYQAAENYNEYMPYMDPAAKVLVLSVILFLTAVIWLTAAAGRRADETNELYLNPFDRWKTELAAALVFVPWLFLTLVVFDTWHGVGYQSYTDGAAGYVYAYGFNMSAEDVCVIAFYAIVTAILLLIGWLSFARRVKARTIWKDSLLRTVLIWSRNVIVKCGHGMLALGNCARTFWRNRRVLWKTIAVYGVFLLFQWIPLIIGGGYGPFLVPAFIMLVADIAAAFFLIRNALEKEQIKKGIREIASGNLDYPFPSRRFQGGDYQDMSENLSNIGNGLQRAVEKSMRDERLKTDLITNVSHDIKTPLTSIINYVDLLKRENFEDPKIQGYLDILEMKSQRLKTLTEDVVEASKVSSGNITLEYMDVDLVEMLNQTIGEFSEKMEAKQLKVVASLPDKPAVIHVDGRRMWRVLENIFNNAAKYAMPGTRVYADLKAEEKKISFTLKNVSEQPLNFSSDELTERFIRGDVSRSTEGSGLGLSIAKSLTEMQGGKFELYLDGDLFKVTIEFEKSEKLGKTSAYAPCVAGV